MSATPTVYFIDDSATMREVIKIAFRRENINVLACNDGASALALMEQTKPDVVISDVIMPDKDGYEVCQTIKQHPRLGKTPVILMSGVVNRSVAERAFAVKADELIRKPFQPQDLINRVKHLLNPKAATPPPAAAAATASATLSSIFSTPVTAPVFAARPPAGTPAIPASPQAAVARPVAPPSASAPAVRPIASVPPVAAAAPQMPARPAATAPRSAGTPLDMQKIKIEILRLEGLVRKLQSELEAEREYARALEEHIKTLQEAE